MRQFIFMALLLLAQPALADTIVAARTLRAQTILTGQDLAIKRNDIDGGVTAEQLIGMEARISLYAGRPITLADVGPPALIERNQVVPLIYEMNGLRILSEGRSLARAGPGEYVRVMNMSSRTTITGRVMPDGRVRISQ
ncbi:Flagellar basal-body P-ring formation protein FlgA [hydrothermal vent metagenome]|uniref:Flagellar basal-body P-ring formation protein FlgA n=1 Tax=hydrothermal vent metagenome TaxID=652676 RepID=A0A3B0RNS3_9ZZZZ